MLLQKSRIEWRQDVWDWENGRPWHCFVRKSGLALCGAVRRTAWDVSSEAMPRRSYCEVCRGILSERLAEAITVGCRVVLSDEDSGEQLNVLLVSSANTRSPIPLDDGLVRVSAESDLGLELQNPFHGGQIEVKGIGYRILEVCRTTAII